MAGLAGRALPPARAPFRLTPAEWLRAGLFAALLFGALGTITALWPNPFFVRMTPVGGWDFVLLAGEALLLGLYLGLEAPRCAVGRAGLGGVLGFLGFGCTLCNKVLLLLLGGPLILQTVEPWRMPLGVLGMAVLALALWAKARRRAVPGEGIPAE